MLLIGGFLVATHLWALINPDGAQDWLRKFPRSYETGVFLTIGATAWFYFMVKWMDLGEFDKWRGTVLMITPAMGLAAIFFMREFLAVRALGTVLLLLAEPVLESAFMRPESVRLLLVSLVYVWILLAMFWVGMPYVMRNQIAWFSASPGRWRAAAFAGLIYGAALCGGSLLVG